MESNAKLIDDWKMFGKYIHITETVHLTSFRASLGSSPDTLIPQKKKVILNVGDDSQNKRYGT